MCMKLYGEYTYWTDGVKGLKNAKWPEEWESAYSQVVIEL